MFRGRDRGPRSVFTYSALRPIQSTSRDVSLWLKDTGAGGAL